MVRVGNKEEMPPINLDCTKSKSHGDICSKNHLDISDGVGVQELLLDNSISLIDTCDMGRVGDEVTWTEEMLPIDPNRTKIESHLDNCNSNYDGNKVGNKEWELDDLESLK